MIQENTNSNTTQNTQTTEEIVNAPSISEDWWQEYDLAIDNLDTKYFVTDFKTYKSISESKNLTNKQISEIAEKGFEESAKRIAGEGKTLQRNNYYSISVNGILFVTNNCI